MENDVDQIWTAAYSVAMGALSVGRAFRGDAPDCVGHVNAMDESAKLIADRVAKTIEERSAMVEQRRRKQS